MKGLDGHGRKRRGITEFVVVVVLIMVSLITGAMLGGFLFGWIGAYVPPAEVSAQSVTCGSTGSAEFCSLSLVNVGGKNVATDGACAIGSHTNGTIVGGGTIPAGGSLANVQCVVSGLSMPAGSTSTLEGAVDLSNGYEVYFVGN